MRRTFSASVVALLALAACTAHVESNMRIDGATFAPTTCVSGQSRGFPGIELADERGARLRLAANLDGTSTVAVFTAASPVGEVLGVCGTVTTQQGVGVINGVRNLEGTASLACKSQRRRVEGTLKFENCH